MYAAKEIAAGKRCPMCETIISQCAKTCNRHRPQCWKGGVSAPRAAYDEAQKKEPQKPVGYQGSRSEVIDAIRSRRNRDPLQGMFQGDYLRRLMESPTADSI